MRVQPPRELKRRCDDQIEIRVELVEGAQDFDQRPPLDFDPSFPTDLKFGDTAAIDQLIADLNYVKAVVAVAYEKQIGLLQGRYEMIAESLGR